MRAEFYTRVMRASQMLMGNVEMCYSTIDIRQSRTRQHASPNSETPALNSMQMIKLSCAGAL
jgi:hypothetical protein